MIKGFSDIDALAAKLKPIRLAALAAHEAEFLLTIRIARERGYIEPVIIGGGDRLKRAADETGLDLAGVEIIEAEDPQTIADTGLGMFFQGEVDIAMKGHIPTAYVYRAIIRQEKSRGRKANIAVNTLWNIPGAGHLATITDTGVSIRPNLETKRQIIGDAVHLMHLFRYNKPRVLILASGTASLEDAQTLREDAAKGLFGSCEILPGTSLWDAMPSHIEKGIKADRKETPHIFLVPHLDAGNILSKLDFILDVTRRSLVMTSKGPVIIPSRSDAHGTIVGEVALGAVVAHLHRRAAG